MQVKLSRFLRVAAICSILGAVTTALVALIPVPVAETFDEKVLLHANTNYMTKLWIFFLHPQLNVIAAFGMSVLFIKKYPEYIIPATLGMIVWAVTESAQQAFTIDAVNQTWRSEYLQETNPQVKAALFAQLKGSEAIRSSMFFLLLFCYGISSTLFGVVLCKTDIAGKLLGSSFLFFGLLSFISFARYYLGWKQVSPSVDFIFDTIYPWLQPAARLGLGLWLWRQATRQMIPEEKMFTGYSKL
jgi:hypothetical protein